MNNGSVQLKPKMPGITLAAIIFLYLGVIGQILQMNIFGICIMLGCAIGCQMGIGWLRYVYIVVALLGFWAILEICGACGGKAWIVVLVYAALSIVPAFFLVCRRSNMWFKAMKQYRNGKR